MPSNKSKRAANTRRRGKEGRTEDENENQAGKPTVSRGKVVVASPCIPITTVLTVQCPIRLVTPIKVASILALHFFRLAAPSDASDASLAAPRAAFSVSISIPWQLSQQRLRGRCKLSIRCTIPNSPLGSNLSFFHSIASRSVSHDMALGMEYWSRVPVVCYFFQASARIDAGARSRRRRYRVGHASKCSPTCGCALSLDQSTPLVLVVQQL